MKDKTKSHRHGGDADQAKGQSVAVIPPPPMTAAAVIAGAGSSAAVHFTLGLGEIRGIRRIRDLLTAETVGALLRLRESKEYRQHGLNWSQTCELIGIPESTLNEEILNLERFGSALFELVRTSEFNRAAIRSLRAAHAVGEIRLLEGSGELVVGDEVIPVTPDNQARISEAFVELLNREKDEKAAVEKKLSDAEATIAKGRTQIEAKEAEISEKDKQLQVAASVLAVMRNDHPLQAEADSVEIRLAELIQKMKNEEFDKAEAAKIHRRLAGRITDLARYAHGALLDPDAAFARLSPEMQQIIRESEAEHANDPYLTGEGDDEFGEVDDEA